MPTTGRTFACPVLSHPVKVIVLLERKHMGLPAVRTFLSCSGMAECLEAHAEPIDLCSSPEDCPLRVSLE